ncbi:MAG: methyl-viologen-reducing hydrogenase subunit delta [Chloroflexi bacterium RBG_13_50_10]|nr:MAG: methyl-viologen-reducing hydrogenase subunit delta [Chloroflexi bacterium RBG_13_50_10]
MVEENLRIGVFVCDCGLNIAGSVDTEEVRRSAEELPDVVVSVRNRYTCADPGQAEIKRHIKEHNLNRVVVASCTPRLHELTFRKCIEDVGLNPYLLEMTSIREHCSWVHLYDRESATKKAKDIVKIAVARARLLQAQQEMEIPVTDAALVIGGGVAGIQAALDLADAGHQVYLVEEKPSIGGIMAELDKTFPTMDCSICVLGPKMMDVGRHPLIKLLAYSTVEAVSGYVGNFKVRIRQKARYVDETLCNVCGKCSEACPVVLPDEFQQGFSSRKAAYIPFPQAVPSAFLIDMEHCLGNNPVACVKCIDACEKKCIDLHAQDKITEVEVGAIIVATGMDVYDPAQLDEYGYTLFENVITSMEFERLICGGGPTEGHLVRPSDHKTPKRIGFIQCVGSRTENRGNPYCSNVCCMNTVKDSLLIKEHDPDAEIFVFYMDIRAFGKGFEDLLRRSREAGVRYIRGLPGEIREGPVTKNLLVKVENTTTARVEEYDLDMVILSVGLEPKANLKKLMSVLNLSQTSDGFLMEAHPKLRPVDAPTPGIFYAGCVEAPKDIKDSVTQAGAAAARSSILLNAGVLKGEAIKAMIDLDACTSCGVCARVCPYGAMKVDVKAKSGAQLVVAACAGCGTCAAECRFDAITMQHFSDAQVLAQIDAALETDPEQKIITFLCNWCSYAASDLAGVSRMQFPPNNRFIRTMCSGRVDEKFILHAFKKGAPLVLLSGCHLGDCHYISANHWTMRRADKLWDKLEKLGIRPERLQLEWISAAEGPRFAQIMRQLEEMRQKVTPEEIAHARKVISERKLSAKEEAAPEDELSDVAKV